MMRRLFDHCPTHHPCAFKHAPQTTNCRARGTPHRLRTTPSHRVCNQKRGRRSTASCSQGGGGRETSSDKNLFSGSTIQVPAPSDVSLGSALYRASCATTCRCSALRRYEPKPTSSALLSTTGTRYTPSRCSAAHATFPTPEPDVFPILDTRRTLCYRRED